MNNIDAIPQKCDKSIFIVVSKLDNNKYKIKGTDGYLLDYVSDEALLPNEVICFSMNEYLQYHKLLSSSAPRSKGSYNKPKNILISDVIKEETPQSTSISSANTEDISRKDNINTMSSKRSHMSQNDLGQTLSISSALPFANNINNETDAKVTKNANIKEAKSVEKNSIIKVHPKEPEKKLLLVDIEQDKSVLRYLRRAYSMAPKEAIRSLLEEKKIQSIFAIYELFSDSRNGCEFGASEFTDKFIKSTIDKIPKGRVFNVIRKIMEADLLKKGTIPYLDDIKKRGWRAYNILSFKMR